MEYEIKEEKKFEKKPIHVVAAGVYPAKLFQVKETTIKGWQGAPDKEGVLLCFEVMKDGVENCLVFKKGSYSFGQKSTIGILCRTAHPEFFVSKKFVDVHEGRALLDKMKGNIYSVAIMPSEDSKFNNLTGLYQSTSTRQIPSVSYVHTVEAKSEKAIEKAVEISEATRKQLEFDEEMKRQDEERQKAIADDDIPF